MKYDQLVNNHIKPFPFLIESDVSHDIIIYMMAQPITSSRMYLMDRYAELGVSFISY